MNAVESLISQIEQTFAKDDLQTAPRSVLEQLIISVYDGLLLARGSE